MPENSNDYFFAIYHHSTEHVWSVALGDGVQQTGHKIMKFTDNVDPMTTPSAVWEIVKNGDANNPYNIINLDNRGYFMQRESGNNSHLWRCSDNGGGSYTWGSIAITYAEGGWQLNTNLTEGNNYIGPWNYGENGNQLNDEFASNKASGSTYYDIYAILRADYYKQGGIYDEQKDLTTLIVNDKFIFPTFGWEGTALDVRVGGSEFYDKTFDSYQVIKNLPAGYYKFTVQGYDRNTDVLATYGKEDAVKQVYLYAGSASVLMKGIYDDASDTQLNGGTDEVQNNGKYMPSLPATAQKYFEAGKYINELYVYHTGGDLRVGVKKDVNGGKDWVYVDNFTLTHVASSPTVQMDFTSSIVNPSFETNDFTGWENTSMQTQNNNAFVGKQGTYYAEIYNINQTFGISQQVQNLPAGFYVVCANAYQHGSYYQDWPTLRAGDKKVNVLSNSDTYYVAAQLQNAGNLSVGFGGRASGNSNWATVDDFHVVYYPTLPDVTAETGAMNADVLATLTSAKTTYDGAKTVDNFNAFQNANMAAKVSEKIYTDISAAIDAQVTADQDKLNKVSQGVKDAYNSYIQTIRDKRTYNTVEEAQAELTDAFANAFNAQAGSVDFTSFITNPDFQASNWWTGWNGTNQANDNNNKTTKFARQTNNADNFPNTVFAEMYGTISAADLNQTINKLPKGVYQLSAKIVAGTPCSLYAMINEKEQSLTCHGSLATKTLTFIVAEAGDVKIGLKHNGSTSEVWVAVDDFKLTYFGMVAPEKPADMTNLIQNADCSSVTGWQGSPSLQNNENFEKFNTDFDVYQEITALPAGWYKVQAQAFDRTTNEAATYGVETALKRAVLYAGDATTLIKGIYEYASDTRLTTGENEETTNNDKWMPNTPAAGTKYFKAGLYDNEVLVYHKGGDLRIGIKKLAQAGNDWCLFDNFRLTYMGNELTENTVMTQYIDDPSFESGTLDYWKAGSTSGGDTGAKLNSDGTYTMSSCDGNYLYNTWGVTPLSVEQTISGLTQGVYSLKAVLAADQNSVITLAMGNASVEATMAGVKGNGQETTLTSIIVREGEDVLLKVSSGTWFKADDFRLTYLRPATDEEIITDAQNSLKALVATANAVDKTTNVGDAIFQIPTSAVTTFNTAITESQTYSEATHTTAEYDAQRATLQAAIDEFKTADYNGPATDTRYVITNVSDSYAHKGNAITFVEGARNDMGLYGIKYLTPANSAYAQAFIVTPVAGKRRTYTLHQIDRDGNARYLCVGTKYSGGNNQQVRTTITAADAEEYRIDCIKEGVYGVYSIAGGSYMGNTQDNNDTYITNEGGKYHMSVAVAQKESVTLAVSNVHWATFIAPFPVDITGMEGLEAYTVAVSDEGLETTVVENSIPANTPVLLYKNTSETFTKILTEYGTAKQQYYTVGNLVGNIGAASVIPVTEGKTNYLLQKQDNKLGFYKIDAGNTKNLKVGKDRAYLQMNTPAANAKEAFLFEDVPTDIGSLQTIDELLNGADIYDLSGKKHNRLQKGINIVNGKKIVLK